MVEPLWLKQPPPKLKLDAFKLDLYPFQRSGAAFLAQNKNCILTDQTGLGKSPQALAAFNASHKAQPKLKAIIVCPASIATQWESEVKKFTVFKFVNYSGSKRTRSKVLETFMESMDVHGLVMTYDILRRDVGLLLDLHKKFPYLMVFDEAQKLKNPSSKTAKAAKLLSMRSYGNKLLTATPIFNKVNDLFGLFKIVNPKLFPNYQAFLDEYTKYFMMKVNRWTEVPTIVGTKNLPKLKELIKPYVFGRKKKDVATELPDLRFIDYTVKLPSHHRETYNNLSENNILTDGDGNIREIEKIAAITHLQRCADALEHISPQATPSHPKIDEIVRIIQEDFEGEKVIVYSKFTSSLRILDKGFKKASIPFYTIEGGLTQERRTVNKNSWEEESSTSVLGISAAGGAGLNLQKSGVIIFLNYPWSYGEILQVYGRIHRIGTEHTKLLIINVFAEDTIDETIRDTLKSKQATFNKMFSDEATGSLSSDILGNL